MSATAHSDFFGLDLDLSNRLEFYTVPPEVWAQAQKNLSRWIDLDDEPTSALPELTPPNSLTDLTPVEHIPTTTNSFTKSPSTRSSSCLLSDSNNRNIAPANNTPRTSSIPTPSSTLVDSSASKVAKSKQFHFVANSDKKTATRLRNTMTSRNLRQSKVSRIAQLEKELEEQLRQTKMWKERAIGLGWSGSDGEEDSQ